MNYLLTMAIRNVGRNRRRSVLAVISVSLSITFIIALQGMISGFMGSMVKNYTRAETGHVRIASKEFEKKYRFMPVTELVHNPEALIEKVTSDAEIAGSIETIAQRFNFGVLLSNEGKTQSAVALAGDPAIEKDLLLLQQSILDGGRYVRGSREMIIGAALARSLGYSVGDTVKVVTQGADYALHMRKFTIVGLFKTNLNFMDKRMFQIGLEDAQKLLRAGNASQQIVIMFDDYHKAEKMAAKINTLIENEVVAATPWTKIGGYGDLVKMQERIYFWFYAIIAFLGSFIIGNIMMMVILERRREIGILKASGFSRSSILGLFFLEGGILGVIGSGIGMITGTLINVIFSRVGIDFSKSMGGLAMPMDPVVYFTVDIPQALAAGLLGVVVAALIALLPSRKAAQMNAVEAIKSV